MSEPVLRREVEVPTQRSTGAAIAVIGAFGVLFSALAASAFVVRVRTLQTRNLAMRASQLQAEADALAAVREHREMSVVWLSEADGPVRIEVTTRAEVRSRLEAELSPGERETVGRYRALAVSGDTEVALELWNGLPGGTARYLLADERANLADEWLAQQLSRLDGELGRGDCGAVAERLARMRRLVPDRALPWHMADCR
jgi:hypothetical protein